MITIACRGWEVGEDLPVTDGLRGQPAVSGGVPINAVSVERLPCPVVMHEFDDGLKFSNNLKYFLFFVLERHAPVGWTE